MTTFYRRERGGARLVLSALTVSLLTFVFAAAIASATPGPSPEPRPTPSGQDGCDESDPDCEEHGNPNDGTDECDEDGDAGGGNDSRCGEHGRPGDDCPTDRDRGRGNDDRCPPGDAATTDLEVGFGVRKITPVGPPPGEWAEFFEVNEKTGVWSEPFEDRDGDGCYDPGFETDVPPEFREPPEVHFDQPWNSAGDAHEHGAFEVDGVTIYGDPQSTGKWDGLWANAGFGATCALGMHDDTWARAMVLEVGNKTVALVSLDVVGFFNIEVRRAREELGKRYPDLPIDELVVSSTHTHEGVDTMGLWAQPFGFDGKHPAYQAFIRSQLIDAVRAAYENREEAFAKFAVTTHTAGIRDSRPPDVIDPFLLAAQFVRADGSTIGTVVNWSNHPEAQGSGNGLISSDFVHGAREVLEQDLGGTAVYFSGSVGGLMTPLRAEVPGFGTEVSWERTYEIGRLVAVAAEDALAGAPVQGIFDLDFRQRDFYMESDNTALRAFNAAGMFDVPTYVGAESWGTEGHRDGVYSGTAAGTQFKTEMVAVQLGPALFLTVPGELFPELEIGGYGREDCPEAHTGRPFEPIITDQFDAQYQFVLGLGQDELGYIVPGYDFWLTRLPQNDSDGGGLIPLGALEAVDPCGESHYEETVSATSVMAPWVTCVAAELAGRDPWDSEPACSRDNTHMHPYGIDE